MEKNAAAALFAIVFLCWCRSKSKFRFSSRWWVQKVSIVLQNDEQRIIIGVLFEFSEVGSSNYPCSEIYAGPKPFSEPEIRSLAEFIKTFDNIKLYISFHSYSQLVLFPYVSSRSMNQINSFFYICVFFTDNFLVHHCLGSYVRTRFKSWWSGQ